MGGEDFLDDVGGGEAGDHGGEDDAAAVGFDDVASGDVVGPVAGFDEDGGEEAGDEGGGFVFVEEGDVVDGFEGGEHEGAVLLVDDGACGALEAADGGVGVDGDDEDVALRAGEGEGGGVSGVEDVEASVGEDDGAAFFAEAAADGDEVVGGEDFFRGVSHAGILLWGPGIEITKTSGRSGDDGEW